MSVDEPDDELRQRLQASMPDIGEVHPAGSAHAASLLEDIMNAPVDLPTAPTSATIQPRRARRGRLAWLAGGAAAVAAVVAFALAGQGSDPAPTSLAFQLSPSDPLTQSCLPISEFQPTPDMIGFGGTVTAIDGGTVTLAVDTWYRGGPADEVVLDAGAVPMAALDGVDFVVGQRYLISVVDGVVGVCGTSGPATPEFEQIFQGWFA